MDNSSYWCKAYDTSEFGNKYPSSYLVSLFHSRIKPILLKTKSSLSKMNALDFGCSIGANSEVFGALGMNIYGLDVSDTAIRKLLDRGIGDGERFKAISLLDAGEELSNVFPDTHFDFIIASEIMYYFKDYERRILIGKLIRGMNKDAVIYISMPTYEHPFYRKYTKVPKDKDGMVEVKQSGSVSLPLHVNLPRDIREMEEMFKPFKKIDILTVDTPMYSHERFIEYHMIATV